MDTSDIRKGLKLMMDGQPYIVVDFQFVKPGKGQAFTRTKMKNMLNGGTLERNIRSGEKLEAADVEERSLQYIYPEGDAYVFMDNATYDQINVPAETVGEAVDYMLENQTATVAMHDGNPLFIELPASVELEITYSEPGLQGDRSTGGTKPATLETGKVIQVPLFITSGEKVKVDTRDGSYLGRATSA